MRRAWILLAVASAVAAFGLGALARVPREPGSEPVAPGRPGVTLSLTVENGSVSPGVSMVRKGYRVHLTVLNRDSAPIRFTLTGYEERISARRIAPDSTWQAVFIADRPGDEFEWRVNDHPAGRFIVLGSHLEEGHE